MAVFPQAPRVGELLRSWRQRRKISQFDLSLDSAVSSRHLSFIETGRSRPSREMVLHLAEKLEVDSGIVGWIGNLDLGDLGYIVVGLFVATWAAAIALWRFGGMERRWQDRLAVD